ncbi:MAG: glycoside hydrolase, partial [Chloroflexi bacterium]
MTIFGPDISSYQAGLDLSRLANASFVLAKTTEGTYYTDGDYQGWRRQCTSLGKPFVWYHFLSGEDPHAQAAHTLANVGDTTLPGMLDAEP